MKIYSNTKYASLCVSRTHGQGAVEKNNLESVWKGAGKKGLKCNGNRCKNLLNVDLVRMLQEEENKCVKFFTHFSLNTKKRTCTTL